jgi:hypothetical protein
MNKTKINVEAPVWTSGETNRSILTLTAEDPLLALSLRVEA